MFIPAVTIRKYYFICFGEGVRMTKIEQLYFDADFNNWDDFMIFKAGHKSRDPEIKELLDKIILRLSEELNFQEDGFSIVTDIFNKALKDIS